MLLHVTQYINKEVTYFLYDLQFILWIIEYTNAIGHTVLSQWYRSWQKICQYFNLNVINRNFIKILINEVYNLH